MCRVGAWSIVLTLMTASVALCQNRPADTSEDVAGQPDEKSVPGGPLQSQVIPPEMEITNELVSDADELEFRRKGGEQAFQNALKSPNATLTDDEKKALDAAAKLYAYRFTLKKYREEDAPPKKELEKGAQPKNAPPPAPKERLPDLRKSLLNVVKTYATKGPVARGYFLKSLTERLAEILDNHLLVRLNAMLLLGQLQSDNGDPKKNLEPTPYVDAYSVMLKAIKDDKQHVVVKIVAVRGLARICRGALPDPNDKRRSEIAMIIVTELAKKETHWWYQMALAECLGATGVTYDPNNKQSPVILQALAEVMADKNRYWQVRVEAARSIGYLPLDGGNLNFAPVAYELVNLGHQMSLAHNAKLKGEVWANFYESLFLAFRAPNANAKVAGGKRKPGLLEALPNSREVKEAYEQVVLMASHVLVESGKQFSAAQLNAVTGWLQTHVPANDRITPGSAPLVPKDKKEVVVPETKPVQDDKKQPVTNPNPKKPAAATARPEATNPDADKIPAAAE